MNSYHPFCDIKKYNGDIGRLFVLNKQKYNLLKSKLVTFFKTYAILLSEPFFSKLNY